MVLLWEKRSPETSRLSGIKSQVADTCTGGADKLQCTTPPVRPKTLGMYPGPTYRKISPPAVSAYQGSHTPRDEWNSRRVRASEASMNEVN